jgi:methyl-accepting chemotaxis protein
LFEDTPEPPKVETIKLQVVKDESWISEGVPPSLVAHLGDVKDTLLQTIYTIPAGLHRDFSVMHEMLANDINKLQTRVDLVSEYQKASRQESYVMGNIASRKESFQTSLNLLSEELKRVSKAARYAAQAVANTPNLQARSS